MKRRLFLAGAVIFALASCTKDPSAPNAGGENSGSTSTGTFTFLNVDQSRIVTSNGAATRAEVTRGATIPTVAEKVPAGWESATQLTPGWHNNLAGGLYKITQDGDYGLSNNITGEVNIVIAENANITFTPASVTNNYDTNIYVLPGATLKMNGSLEYRNNIYCWGTLNLPDWFTMKYNSTIHYYGDQLKLNNFKTENVASGFLFESYAPITFEGTTYINGGDFHFFNQVTFENFSFDNYNQQGTTTFDDCVTIHKLYMNGPSQTPKWIVNKYLYIGNLDSTSESNKLDIVLNNALLVIDNGNTYSYLQRDVTITGVSTDGQTSGVRILQPLTVYKNSGGNLIPNFKGDLTILGRPIDLITSEDPEISLQTTADNNKKYTYGVDESVTFNEGVEVNKAGAYLKGNVGDCHYNYIYGTPDVDDDDIPGAWILPPTGNHKYSATGISFNSNEDDLVYVSWHSNLHGNVYGDEAEYQEDDFYHEHGTNEDYDYPSVEGEDDWGGIIDVIRVPNYTADGSLFEKTVYNDDFKYNHVLYNGGKLYLPATSWKVGAALNVIDLAGDMLPDNIDAASKRVNLTGVSANCVEIDGNNIWTVSGRSYGAVNMFSTEILTAAANDEGDEEEGPKKNPLNQTENYVEGDFGDLATGIAKEYKNGTVEYYTKGYEDFGGKYVVRYNNAIYVLHNTKNAVVSIFNLNGTYTGQDIELGVSLVPNDGKNVMLIDNGTIYVCCGQNGFYAFDMQGNRVSGSMKHANGCDFDDEYIYLATGDGLAILDKKVQVDATREITDEKGKVVSTEPVYDDNGQPLKVYKTVKYVHYTGKGFNYPRGDVPKEGEIKESSNFVKVHNGKIYVAYGMYGLRIYDPTLIPEKAK